MAALACLLGRLVFLQIFKSSSYFSLAQSQYRALIEMQPARGRIVDRKGRDLALDVRLDSLYAVAREIKDKDKVAAALAKALDADASDILRRLSRDKMFVWLGRKLPIVKAEAVKALKIPEVGFTKESMRVYPKGETACHLLGFTVSGHWPSR